MEFGAYRCRLMTPETPTRLESSAPVGVESNGSAGAHSTFDVCRNGRPRREIVNRDLQIPLGLPRSSAGIIQEIRAPASPKPTTKSLANLIGGPRMI